MAGPFDLESVWHDENFRVRKGILPADTTFSGFELGRGVIYYTGAGRVMHRLLDEATETNAVVGETGHEMRCLWNSGSLMQVMNPSHEPLRFVQIQLNYKPIVRAVSLSEDATAVAMAHLLHGQWPAPFKSSVTADVDAIESLARRFVDPPSTSHAEDLSRAVLAKEDLEFKLAWFAAAIRELSRSPSSLEAGYGDHRQLLIRRFGLPFFHSGDEVRTDPPLGMVKVIVNTKDADGPTDVSGYEVWSSYFADQDNPKRADRFPRLSTPTTRLLPVGHYAMWARRGAARGPLSPVWVGSVDAPLEREQIVDLFAS
jgi:hypothetical protein